MKVLETYNITPHSSYLAVNGVYCPAHLIGLISQYHKFKGPNDEHINKYKKWKAPIVNRDVQIAVMNIPPPVGPNDKAQPHYSTWYGNAAHDLDLVIRGSNEICDVMTDTELN